MNRGFTPASRARDRLAAAGLAAALLGTATAGTIACGPVDRDDRAAALAPGGRAPRIGLVWDRRQHPAFLQGAALGRDEINAAGGVLGFQVSFIAVDAPDDGGDDASERGRDVARRLAGHADLAAVIGHTSAASAVAASIVYEEHGILYLNPVVADRSLNHHGFEYVFSMTPDNGEVGEQSALFAYERGFRRIGILGGRDAEATQLADGFAQQAARLGLIIGSRTSFGPDVRSFRGLLTDMIAQPLDALFLAADDETCLRIVEQANGLATSARFLLAAYADIDAFRARISGVPALVAAPVRFDPFRDGDQAARFRTQFRTRYGNEPDGWAAQGYDAVRLIAEAMREAGSPVPLALATTMRRTLAWHGLTGRYSFDRNGAVYTRALDFTMLEHGRLRQYIAERDVPDSAPRARTADAPPVEAMTPAPR